MSAVKDTKKFTPMKTRTSLSKTSLDSGSDAGAIHLPPASPVTWRSFPSDWRGSVGSTALELEKSIGSLAGLYTFRDHVQVANFLRENPFLIDFLAVAYGKIQQYFGLDVRVALEVFIDPEAEDEQELSAFIQARLPLQEEIDFLERFNEEWWLDNLSLAQYKLAIDIE